MDIPHGANFLEQFLIDTLYGIKGPEFILVVLITTILVAFFAGWALILANHIIFKIQTKGAILCKIKE